MRECREKRKRREKRKKQLDAFNDLNGLNDLSNGLLTTDHGRHGRLNQDADSVSAQNRPIKNSNRAIMGVPL